MDFDSLSASDFGRSLTGVGLNLLTRDVRRLAGIIANLTGADIHRISDDFAIVAWDGSLFQIHRDPTFAGHPLHATLPETGLRGAGVQIYLFNTDPDAAVRRARDMGLLVLEEPRDKPHGLREATVLTDEGYALTLARARHD